MEKHQSLFDEIKLFFRQTWTVGSKEFAGRVRRPMFSVLIGAAASITGPFFFQQLAGFSGGYSPFPQQQGRSSIHAEVFMPHVSLVNFLLLFLAPLLAMALLTEEKKSRSFDLLMTAPLSSLHITAGKYFALLAQLALFILISLIYPLSTAFFADIPFRLLFSAYAGLFFLAANYGAIGLFTSSLTKSNILSFFAGLILILLWFSFALWGSGFQSQALSAAMDYLSAPRHFEELAKGHVLISSLAFFVSVTVFFLFLARSSLEFSRWRP